MKNILTIAALLTVAVAPALAQKIKKQPPKKVDLPASMTICAGEKIPENYTVVDQTVTVECVAKNQTGKAFLISKNVADGETTTAASYPRNSQTMINLPGGDDDSGDDDEIVVKARPRARQNVGAASAKEDLTDGELRKVMGVVSASENLAQSFASRFGSTSKQYDYRGFAASVEALKDGIDVIGSFIEKPQNRTILSKNRIVIQDIYAAMNLFKSENALYQDDVRALADEYGATPTTAVSGEQVISRQIMFGKMLLRLKNNFDGLANNLLRG